MLRMIAVGRPKSTYGYSLHAGVDEDGFIHRQSVMPGNVHDLIRGSLNAWNFARLW